MKWRRYKYFYKLWIMFILVLFVPVSAFIQFFWKQSYERMEKNNERYYEKILDSFSESFIATIQDLLDHAASVAAYSKQTDSAFWQGEEDFKKNKYWYYEAVEEINEEHMSKDGSLFGLYYYDLDCVITANGTQSRKSFLETLLQKKGVDQELYRYFKVENFEAGQVVYGTSNSDGESDGVMLVGYYTTMGKNYDKVLIFHILYPEDYKKELSIVRGSEGINFYILDEEQETVYLGLKNVSDQETLTEDMPVYGKQIQGLPLYAQIVLTENTQYNNLETFYQNARWMIWGATIILFILSFMALCVAYKPVKKIVSELDEFEGDEFAVIRSALDQNSVKIQEQELLIMDLLMNHLLHGFSIPEEKVKKLGIASSVRYYCVFMVEGSPLSATEMEEISDNLQERFFVKSFATDWQEEKSSVFILFLREKETEQLEEWLKIWLEERYLGENHLFTGNMVDKMDDIRSSLLSCLEKKQIQSGRKQPDKQIIKNELKSVTEKEEKQQKMKDDILSYLENHYRDDDLSQAKVADAFGISKYTLSRLFKNQVGVGFTEYVNAKRLEYAKELLLTTEYTIREISLMAGFSNDNYFSRIFKATVGISATAFRER